MAVIVPSLEIKGPFGLYSLPISCASLTIGRGDKNMLVLDEPLASRVHCTIEKHPDGFYVHDMNSHNGTLLNGKIVKEAALQDGDVISVGNIKMKFIAAPGQSGSRSDEAAPPTETAPKKPAPSKARHYPPPPPAPSPDVDSDEAAVSNPAYANAPMWERTLRDRADALANRPFTENDIQLVNTRGQVANLPASAPGKTPSGSEAVTMLRLILLVCFRSRATDIHVEMKQDDVQVRIRVDGVMIDILKLYKENRDLGIRLLSLIKVLCEIDIAQRNVVQEGSFSTRVPTSIQGTALRRVDYRVSFAPAVYGQKLVVRIFDTANSPQHIDDLLLPDNVVEPIRRMIQRESGMILSCGPTGSGKTTTLYAILRDIDVHERNVVTIEDPVEIQIDGVTQIPVNESQGNSFPALLKSVLRQDPDLILVGEVRDAETARIAMQSAMTGHLVFSTVHANDAVGAIYRLLDLGVEPYLVSSGLQMVLAQRLVRQLCVHCKKPIKTTSAQMAAFAQHGVPSVPEIYIHTGCRRCLNTGFLGRRSVVELLVFTSALRDVILKSPGLKEITKSLTAENYIRLATAGFQLVADGLTSFAEADAVVG